MTDRAASKLLGLTSFQTVGPFFQIGLEDLYQPTLAGEGVLGSSITISGQILDADRVPVPDALIEVWQANRFGKYAHPDDPQEKRVEPGFTGFGRFATDEAGAFRFQTIQPGAVASPNKTLQAPHISVSILMRGLLNRLVTRIYFAGDERNDTDEIFNLVAAPRRPTLLAQPVSTGSPDYRWNVILQGVDETVFFDF